ncbi:lipoprotein [Devosia limi DSM 17137]|uniref:Lipoprotein n=1 Tax=Devosia limi DSM 17137 TaxID=1121477 RepID=A0A0F5LKE6_9HYPH|nr:murein L,D-transpeptidase family protein [Devosia limi]KKB82750.1 lipoprotein [Devosia limi DSM 17137]SHF46141.1 Murein L,D-transpeptidase YafK [Devosia limi DSM 17137]
MNRHPLRFLIAIAAVVVLAGCSQFVGDNRHNVPLNKELVARLAEIGSSPAQPMVIRVYKQSSELEVWKRTNSGQYALLKTFPICKWSGALGPKIREGDHQSPEGFYDVTPALMNPKSAYWLSFNVGFPNKFDQAWGRTGTNLMVHGDCRSVGCFAMTDEGIKEIYALARESFRGGNRSFQLQLLPFRMTDANLAQHAASPHAAFWGNLKQGTDAFDRTKQPPAWDVCEKKYVFNPPVGGLDPAGACPVTPSTVMANF